MRAKTQKKSKEKNLITESEFFENFDGGLDAFFAGNSRNCYKLFGSRPMEKTLPDGEKKEGVEFTVWAPNAISVTVVGNFNNWGNSYSSDGHIAGEMSRDRRGIWYGFVENIGAGECYKYKIVTGNEKILFKADPFSFTAEVRPGTASVVYDFADFRWTDSAWMKERKNTDYLHSPVNIYEVHLGSWRRGDIPGLTPTEAESCKADEPFMNYREIADKLAPYAREMNYTHVELMPVCEHPFDGSWGYQTTSYYAITSRYGTPDDFKYMVNKFHKCGIGVILDWVPSHFCKDEHGLYCFDGSWLYENEVDEIRENREWGTANMALGKPEVQSFLISNALYFFNEFHADGIRVDAVTNMLYLDYSKKPSKKLKNKYGGNENIEGIDFCRKLNSAIYESVDNPIIAAEESTAWPLVTKPCYIGGLGFTFKWNMGWMNDTLEYMKTDSFFRHTIHNKLTFSSMYCFSENYILPLSHDEVVHGKKSLLDKCFGTYEQKFDALRCYYTYMCGHPGKKLLFMGGEFAPFMEWRYYEELEWKLLLYPKHSAMREFVKKLNEVYKTEPALWENDTGYDGFEWIDADNANDNVLSFMRKSKNPEDFLIFVMNFSPVERKNFMVGVPRFADYAEILNTDRKEYGGSGLLNENIIRPEPQGLNGKSFRIRFDLPANGAVVFKPDFERHRLKGK